MSKIKTILVVVLLVGGAGAGALIGLNKFYQKQIQSQSEMLLANAEKDFVEHLRVKAFNSIQKLTTEIKNEKLAGPLSRLASIAADATPETVAQTLKPTNDSILPEAEAIHKKLKLDNLLVISSGGRVVARSPGKEKFGDSLKGIPAVKECQNGIYRDGLYELGGKLFQVAVVPLRSGSGSIVGCLMSTSELNIANLKALSQPAGLDVAIFLRKKVKLSSIEPASLAPLAEKLESKEIVHFGALKSAPLLFSLPAGALAAKIASVPSGTDPMHVALILPLAPLVTPLQEAQKMLFMGVGALLIFGILIGLLLSSGSGNKQLYKLRDSVNLLAEGGSTSFNAEGYSGAYQELARDIAHIMSNGQRPMAAGPASVSEALGEVDDFAPPPPTSQPEPDAPGAAGTLDFESLLGGDAASSAPPPPSAPEPPPTVQPVPPPAASSPDPVSSPDPLDAVMPSEPPAPSAGPRVDVPGDLVGIFDEQEETREVEPIVPERARRDPIQPAPPPTMEVKPEFVAPSAPPASISSPDMDFDNPPDLDGGDDQITSSDYQPDATVIAQVPNELLQAASDSSSEESIPAAAIPPPPPSIPGPPLSTPPAKQQQAKSAGLSADDAHFKEVFDQFLKTKKQCGEAIAGLSFERFSEKLRKNTGDLKTRYKCRSVKFQVYVKNGKAALRATPIK
jgi:type II secretory pathway pseudopilin PulG